MNKITFAIILAVVAIVAPLGLAAQTIMTQQGYAAYGPYLYPYAAQQGYAAYGPYPYPYAFAYPPHAPGYVPGAWDLGSHCDAYCQQLNAGGPYYSNR